MKKILILSIGFLLASPAVFSQDKAGRTDTTKHVSLYTCPMHSAVKSHEAGKCPECGMDLKLTKKEEMNKGVVKTYVCPVHADVAKHNPGKCPQCGKKLNLSAKEQMKAEVTKIYTCPMHPEVALDKDGKCPKCGGELTEKKQSN